MKYDLYLFGNNKTDYIFYSNSISYSSFLNCFSMDNKIELERAIIECGKGANYKIRKIENKTIEIREFYLELSNFCIDNVFLNQVDGKVYDKVSFNICDNDELHLLFIVTDINYIKSFLDILLEKSTKSNTSLKNKILESIYLNANRYCEFKDDILINIHDEFPE